MPRRRPAMNTAFGVVFSLAAICSTPSLPRAISMTSRSLFIDRPISVGFRWLERRRYAGGEHSCQRVMTVESLAARACHHAVRFLGRHQFAPFPHGAFVNGSIPPGLKISFRPHRQEGLPSGPEGCAGFLKRCGGGILAFPWPGVWAETAAHSDDNRATQTPRDRAKDDVTAIDAPAVSAFPTGALG
jgi:hypothetical protein